MALPPSSRDWITGVASEGVVTIGDPRLKAPTLEATSADQVKPLLDAMVSRLRSLNGAGLAAPQIGAATKAIVVEVRRTDVFPDRPEHPLVQMVNPMIVDHSAGQVTDWEGCFSVPGIMGPVPRFESITVTYLNEAHTPVTQTFTGYVARVVQHEIDHLSGVEFVDRMADLSRLTTVANYLAHHRINH
ncbi:peptide deformylase [Catellatospora vulcania]|uniref:peptide deformylase n=1 Tax=Catellatospora vulcania TaxID=1460450 RepID=UPI0012D3FFC3|nr:peptide deformylase [Catellatospora vulcania]